MLRITIELVPWGIEARKRLMGVAEIWNDATGTKSKGHYKFRILKRGNRQSVWKAGELKDFPRLRLGVWDLMFRMLRDVVGVRNGEPASVAEREEIDDLSEITSREPVAHEFTSLSDSQQ